MNILQSDSIEKIGIRWGLITFILLSVFFLLMKLIGFVNILELRFLNAFIMFFGCYMAIKTAKNNLKQFKYFKGLAVGGLNGLVASLIFILFGFLYVSFIDPDFRHEIKLNEPLGLYFDIYVALFQIFMEGVGSGFLFSFIIMQWMKKPRTLSEEQ
ncbi:MAG: DUF4199 domain-containing protein [Cyclobacteriaceae bacterium]|nr:DUF4199 domain-containing protein [Cyclobacteriaceae bacterium]